MLGRLWNHRAGRTVALGIWFPVGIYGTMALLKPNPPPPPPVEESEEQRELKALCGRLDRIEDRLLARSRAGEQSRAAQKTVTVGSMNIMDGCRLSGLLQNFTAGSGPQQPAAVLDVLCLQENVVRGQIKDGRLAPTVEGGHAGALAAVMGGARTGRFACHTDAAAPRLVTVYDTAKLELVGEALIELPLLAVRPPDTCCACVVLRFDRPLT